MDRKVNTNHPDDVVGAASHPATPPPAGDGSNTPTPARSAQMSSTPPTVPRTDAPARQTAASNDASELGQTDPGEKTDDFDWEDLERRYHEKMRESAQAEQQIHEEFASLMTYFSVWSQTASGHEVDRSFKRLRTRMHHVQHSEDQLEQKRQHYVRVVKAFESALSLLNGP